MARSQAASTKKEKEGEAPILSLTEEEAELGVGFVNVPFGLCKCTAGNK